MSDALHVRSHLRGAVALPGGPPALDSLLAAAVAIRDGYPPVTVERRVPPVPLEWCEVGYHLSSHGFYLIELVENRWKNRRFPLYEAQLMGSLKLRRINQAAGAQKSYRLPMETVHLVEDRVDWLCVGERHGIEELLGLIGYLGKRHAVGLGRVLRWEVLPYQPWPETAETVFPVLLEGIPLRPLPASDHRVRSGEQSYRTLSYPYFEHHREEPCWTTTADDHQRLSRRLFT